MRDGEKKLRKFVPGPHSASPCFRRRGGLGGRLVKDRKPTVTRGVMRKGGERSTRDECPLAARAEKSRAN